MRRYHSFVYYAAVALLVLCCTAVAEENTPYGAPLLTFLEGLNRGMARVEDTLERVPGATSSVLGHVGRVTGGEAARAAENVVRVASDAAGAARPVIKGTLALRSKLEFLKKSLDAVEAAGEVIRSGPAAALRAT